MDINQISEIMFSLPEQFGVTMTIDGDTYPLFPNETKLHEELIATMSDKQEDRKLICLLDAPKDDMCGFISLEFQRDTLAISRNGVINHYNMPYQHFRNAFLQHVKKYALYFVAPYNYQAIMLLPFDEMVTKMKRREPEAKALEEKINSIL